MDLKLTSYDTSEFFKEIITIDQMFSATINSFMCTDFCICPGTPTDSWYKAYMEIPDAKYAKYDRVKLGYTGSIDFERFGDPLQKNPLFFAYDPTDNSVKEDLNKLSS